MKTFPPSNRLVWKSWYTRLVRAVGYGLLLLLLFDLVAMVIPFRFMDPNWEFQRFGELIEKIAVPLIAIAMIFFGEEQPRGKFEQLFLKGLSWFCLLAGIGLIFLIPFAVSNTHRLLLQSDALIETQYRQQKYQAEQLEQQLKKATDEQVKEFLQSQGRYFDNLTPQQIETELLSIMTEAKHKLWAVYEAKRADQRSLVLKNCIKWSLGAVVSGIVFIYIWRLTKDLFQIRL